VTKKFLYKKYKKNLEIFIAIKNSPHKIDKIKELKR
jgi:hypothetical protein